MGAPSGDAREHYRIAVQLEKDGDYENALIHSDKGLAIAPGDLGLLELKARVLLQLRDYLGALAGYRAYVAAGASGRSRREAQYAIERLRVAQSTSIAITLSNGPAAIYLDTRTLGVFCTAAPSCTRAMLPGDHKVIAERDGFERWTGQITVEEGKTASLAISLVEKPSLLTVRAQPPGARILVDGGDHDAATALTAGKHVVVVSLAGHSEVRREVIAKQGEPLELDVVLVPLPPAPVASARASPEPLPESASRNRAWIGKAVAAGGGLAIGGGMVFGVIARSAYADASALCGPDRICDSGADFERGDRLVGNARRYASTATLLAAAGSAAVATGLIVWLTAPRTRDRPTARIVPTSRGDALGLAILGSF